MPQEGTSRELEKPGGTREGRALPLLEAWFENHCCSLAQSLLALNLVEWGEPWMYTLSF